MAEKININFITASLGKGGAERVVSELANYYCCNGFNVKIIKLCYKDNVYKLNDRIEVVDFSDINISNQLDLLFKRARYLRNYVLEHKKDNDIYISFQDYVSNIVCLAFLGVDAKLIVSERNDPLKSTLVNKTLKRFLYHRVDGFVFQTKQALQCFSKRIRNKSRIISNPLKNNLPTMKELNNNHRIIAVGRLTEQKNHLLLIDSFRLLKKIINDAELHIYGDGELKEYLINYIKDLNIKDVYIKPFTDKIFDEILKSRIYVMSSDFEGMPNSLMEALAIGIPCVSTDCRCGGPRELIGNNEIGLLAKVKDKNDLSNKMALLLENNELANNYSKLSIEKMKEYSIKKISNQWLDFIDEIMGK